MGASGGRAKEYRYLFSFASYLFEANAHLLCVAAHNSVPQHIAKALVSILALLFGVYELVERRRQALPLLSGEIAELIDIALEGSSIIGPVPNIPELAAISQKLTDLKIKQAKEKVKAE